MRVCKKIMHEHTDMKIGENTLDTLFYYLEKINICNIQYVTSKSCDEKKIPITFAQGCTIQQG